MSTTITDSILSTLSEQWVHQLSVSLSSQGRIIEGGWPGTVSEARVRVGGYFAGNDQPLTLPRKVELSKALYRQARDQWRSVAKRTMSQHHPET